MKQVLLTGSTGSIGRKLYALLQEIYAIDAPSHEECSLSDQQSVSTYILQNKPSIIIHCAAKVAGQEAEKERGRTDGSFWNTNVRGTQYLIDAAHSVHAFVIFISTGSVFSGESNQPGPFSEEDTPSEDSLLSWYAVTKKHAEAFLSQGAIVRLSHPVGGKHAKEGERPDYLEKMIHLYSTGSLYPLFHDVLFPLTYIPDLVSLIQKLVEEPKPGIFHPVSTTLCSPYELFQHTCLLLGLDQSRIEQISFQDFIAHQDYPLQFSQYYALQGLKTAEQFHLPKRTWEEVVTRSLKDYKFC